LKRDDPLDAAFFLLFRLIVSKTVEQAGLKFVQRSDCFGHIDRSIFSKVALEGDAPSSPLFYYLNPNRGADEAAPSKDARFRTEAHSKTANSIVRISSSGYSPESVARMRCPSPTLTPPLSIHSVLWASFSLPSSDRSVPA